MDRYLNGLRASSIRSLKSAAAQTWWGALQNQNASLREFADLHSLIVFFDRRDPDAIYYEKRDAFLRILLAEHQRKGCASWTHDVFVLSYFPLLKRISAEFGPSRKGKSLDETDVAPQVVHAFLQLLATLNERTNRDIHTSIIKSTRRDFVRWASREFRRVELLDELGPLDVDDSADVSQGDWASGHVKARSSGWELDVSELVLDELLRRRVIDVHNHLLLVGTVVYEQQLKHLVSKPMPNGKSLSYEAAKKRLQRAQAQIREYLVEHDLELSALVTRESRDFSNFRVPGSQGAGRHTSKAKK